MEDGTWGFKVMAESKRNYSEGYWLVKPQLGKLTVTNLVNFAEAEGAYGVASSGILRVGKSALFFGIYIVVCLLLSFIVKNWFVSLCLWVLFFPLPFRLISLFVFDERRVRKEFKLREELKSKTDTSLYSTFFGIYDIDNHFPYVSYRLDGSLGIFLRCVRKTQVGNIQEKAFNHSQGLADFYNRCAQLGVKPELIDIQASNSYDERFDDLYNHLNEVSSPTMQKILASMYHHWEDNTSNSQLTYEYFLIRGVGDSSVFWDKVTNLISALMGASYKRIQVLNQDQIAILIGDLYGLEDFPITDAMDQAVKKSDASSLRLLWVGDAQGRKKQVNRSITVPRGQNSNESPQGSQKKVSKRKQTNKDKSEVLDLFGESPRGVASGLTGLLDSTEVTETRVSSKSKTSLKSPEDLDLFS